MSGPLILDFDRSVGELPGSTRVDLTSWQEAIRFGCSLRRYRRLCALLGTILPARHGTAFLGSGDYHHLTWALVERCAARDPFDVVVFDNHPDNMRFPFGVHCGSWVRRVALSPRVRHVHVVGITSADVSAAHAWENYLTPLRTGRLTYWTVGVDTRWAARIGAADACRAFDSVAALVDRFSAQLRAESGQVYLSIDKDVLSPAVAHTNWDQGRMDEAQLSGAIAALHGRIVASDVTGDVSVHRYRSWWKRRLSALDEQPAIDPGQLAGWQAQQHALNLRLVERIAAATALERV